MFLQIFSFFIFLQSYVLTADICPDGSVPYYTNSSLCFSFHSEMKNFIDAEGICLGLNGHLASVHDMFENLFIGEKAASNFTESSIDDFWFGANAALKPGFWSWMDNTLFDFIDWEKGEPKNLSGNFCGAINLQNGQWSSDDCYKKKPFVCLTSLQTSVITTKIAPTKTTTPSKNPSPCLWGWTYNKKTKYCYALFQESYEWAMAEERCTIDGAHLASIHSTDEAMFVANLGADKDDCYRSTVFIGFHTEDNNTHWRWTDGTSFDYANWSPGNPTLPGIRNCGTFLLANKCNSNAGQFVNAVCDGVMPKFICKMKRFK
uniref:C-type lectin domain-containing protein n=1 Tax=Panagrolaimus superbus TaxID=310955 RepID=A0A914XXC5_9BILA